MAKKTISNSFTVNTVEDGVIYEIQSSVGSIKIPSNQTTTSKTITFRFYSKEGDSEKQAFDTYFTIYTRNNVGFYSLVYPPTSSLYHYTSVSRTFDSITTNVSAIVIYIWGANSSSVPTGNPQSYPPENYPYLAKFEIPILKDGNDGQAGERGKMGRFFYYAQEWVSSDKSYNVSDAQAPYFGYTNPNTGAHTYWVFNPEENGDYTMAEMGAPSNESDEWEIMTNDFKYIITEAIFGKSARLASFIMNGDLMFSQEGLYANADTTVDDDISYDLYSWKNPSSPQKETNRTTKVVTLISSDFPDKQGYTLIDFTATQQYSNVVDFYPYEYDNSYLYFKAGVNYVLRFQCSTQVKCYLRFFNNSLTPLYPTPSSSDYEDILVANIPYADYSTPFETVFQVAEDGQYEIVFTKYSQSSSEPNVRSVILAQRFFSPNIVIDGKTGFIFQRKGEECYYQHGLFEGATINNYLSLKKETKLPIYNSNTGVNKYVYVDENGYLRVSTSERPIGGF